MYKVEDTPKGTFYTSHWFDGLAHTHRFDIVPQDDTVKVFYSSRRQSDDMMAYIQEHGRRKYFSFGQRRDPCLGLFAKIMSTWRASRIKPADKGIENVNVVVHPNLPGLVGVPIADGAPVTDKSRPLSSQSGHRSAMPESMWVATDNSTLKQMDPETLEPIGFATQQSLHPDLGGPMSCAHAQRDPETGDVFNFNLQMGRFPTYRIFRVSASTGKTDILATITGPGIAPAYIHSFFLSPSYVVLCIPSSHLAFSGLKVLWERNILNAIEPFSTDKKCKWFVVDRLHGKGVVARFESEAGFFFHTINAFEERIGKDSGSLGLYCDAIEYPSLDIMSSLYYDVLLGKDGADARFWGDTKRARSCMARLARYQLNISTVSKGSMPGGQEGAGAITKVFSIPAPHCGDLPTINPRFATRQHRYVYSLSFSGRSMPADGIVKTDTETREARFWNISPGHTPGEAIFVPRPDGTDEDDGILLSVVLDGSSKTSYLICLDAKTMSEVGRAEIGFAVAFGFHGVHVQM